MLLLRFYRDMVKGNCSCGSVGGMVAFVAMEHGGDRKGGRDRGRVPSSRESIRNGTHLHFHCFIAIR